MLVSFSLCNQECNAYLATFASDFVFALEGSQAVVLQVLLLVLYYYMYLGLSRPSRDKEAMY